MSNEKQLKRDGGLSAAVVCVILLLAGVCAAMLLYGHVKPLALNIMGDVNSAASEMLPEEGADKQKQEIAQTFVSSKTVVNFFKNRQSAMLNSEAKPGNGVGGTAAKVLKEIQNQFGNDVQTFRLDKDTRSNTYNIYYTDQSISTIPSGQRVTVTKYDATTGKMTTGTMTWQSIKTGNQTYRILTDFKAS